jgi:nicotinamidase-related amidase
MSKRALVVVDIQNDYFPGGKWTLSGIEAAADNAARLIASARAGGDQLIYIRHEFATDNAPFFAPGSEGAQIHSKVRNQEGDRVILKHYANSFRETNLKDMLDRDGIREVTICGAMSHMCIDATARAASDFGYKVTVVHDACASRDLAFNGTSVAAAQAHAAFMAALGSAYATLCSTDEYLEGAMAGASAA